MKMEKKHWIIVGIIIALILVWYFFLRKKPAPAATVPSSGKTGENSNFSFHDKILQKYIILHDTTLLSPAAFVGYTGDTSINSDAGGIARGTIVRGHIENKNLKGGPMIPAPYLRIADLSAGKANGLYVPPKAYSLYVPSNGQQNS